MTLIAIAVMGVLAYTRLPAELNPRVEIPTLTVMTIYPGAGPQEMESLITRPIEDAVGTVNNVKDVYSSSQESISIISMDFNVGSDLDRALVAVREKVEGARVNLPQDVRPPIVARLDINAQPVFYLGIAANVPSRKLREIVDTLIKPQLSRVSGVATVNVVGGEQREIHVNVDPERLTEYGLTLEDLVTSLKAANQNIPAGSINTGSRDIAVRTLAAFTSLDDIRSAQILAPQLLMAAPAIPGMPTPKPSAPLTMGDVASVVDTVAPPSTVTRVNGRESVGIIITKVSDANTVAVVDGVKKQLEPLKKLLPPDTELVVSRDDSIIVRDALEDVNATMILGAILAMTVVFFFLHNFRGTLIVAVALPACLVATALVMYFAGFTLNQMTLLALSLSVGILIDDSIVVLESITRHLAAGERPKEAAYNGRMEIGFADITTTLVDVVVFLPVAFMGGIVGAFFRQFGLTIVAATLFSLLVSFTVTPSLASRWYKQGENPEQGHAWLSKLGHFYKKVDVAYRALIIYALRNRWWVVATGATALISALLFTIPTLGFEFLPATDQGQIAITVELAPDASLTTTDAVTRKIEARIDGMPEIKNYVTTDGEILGGFGSIPQQGAQYAQVNIRLKDKMGVLERLTAPFIHDSAAVKGELREHSDDEVATILRDKMKDIPGGKITVSTVRTVANVGPPVQIQLRGTDLNALSRAGEQLRDLITPMPGILDPDISVRSGRPEAQIRIDRTRAASLNVPPAQAGACLRDALEGNIDTTFRSGGTEYPLRVQLSGMRRNDMRELSNVPVAYNAGRAVTLGQISSLSMGVGPSVIERFNGLRMVTVSANLAAGYPLGNAQNDITERMAALPMEGIQVHWGGETEVMNENITYFVISFGLAIILVYLVMASLFNSLLNPFIIMFTLPMALVGALGALAITHESLSLVALIGIIMLTGLMGRNAILMLDYAHTLRSRGMERDAAVALAGATRLRPIMMTTLATIFGMLPVALRIGRASELRAPMAIVVIGGLMLSTLLTLVVIPVIYTLFDDFLHKKSSVK